MKRLAVIGGGFMGSALVEGLLGSGWRPAELVMAEKQTARAAWIREHLHLEVCADAAEAAGQAESVLFAVKPQDMQSALQAVAKGLGPEALVISIAAGVRIATLEKAMGRRPVIRAMPNTPVAIGMGATALSKGENATDTHLVTAINIFGCVGRTAQWSRHPIGVGIEPHAQHRAGGRPRMLQLCLERRHSRAFIPVRSPAGVHSTEIAAVGQRSTASFTLASSSGPGSSMSTYR